MLKVLMLGFKKEEIVPNENCIFALHQPGIPSDMSYKEYFLKCISMGNEADLIAVKNLERDLAEDEVIMAFSAYSRTTPIFGVGSLLPNYESFLISAMYSNVFRSLEDLLDHINVHYAPKRIM